MKRWEALSGLWRGGGAWGLGGLGVMSTPFPPHVHPWLREGMVAKGHASASDSPC